MRPSRKDTCGTVPQSRGNSPPLERGGVCLCSRATQFRLHRKRQCSKEKVESKLGHEALGQGEGRAEASAETAEQREKGGCAQSDG